MAGKARVHELAKELGVTSKEVLARLSEQGEFVKSASSTVEAPVARRLRESLPAIGLVPGKDSLKVRFPLEWLDANPLTTADLEQEKEWLAARGFELDVADPSRA